jgi:predicted aldo/keto reductase-like oxidoreductase
MDVKKLGFGYMRLPRVKGGFDYEQINKMADTFLESGFTYFDAAYVYEGAEVAFRESVVKRYPRDKFTIATKLNLGFVDKPEDMDKQFKTSLERLGTDFVDFYMLHGINAKASKKAESLGAWQYLQDLKAAGKIKHAGFSFHAPPEDLEEILTKHPEAEFVQLQINYLDWNDPKVESRRLYEIARKHGKPVIIMEPLKGGMLTADDSPVKELLREADPEASTASWALRFAVGLEGVFVVLSGMSTYEQLADNIKTVAGFKPLSNTEQAVLDKAVAVFGGIPRIGCTACNYCKECPQKIKIPQLIDIYNNYLKYNTTNNTAWAYTMATRDAGKPGDCIECGTCENACPQKLSIIDTLAKMAELY